MTTSEFSQILSDYERSLDLSKRKADGIFYTDLLLTGKIVAELAIPVDAVVLDPCCGGGSFNYSAIQSGIKHVYGADLDKTAIDLCKVHIPEAHFVAADSIRTEARTLFAQFPLPDKADYVVGNPPYAKWIPSKDCAPAFNKKVMKSGNNLFVAGLIKAMELVKENGVVSYIIPKNFLHVTTYSELRKEILQTRTILSIIDIGAYFKKVRGEQVILTFKNCPPLGNKFAIKKLVNGSFFMQMEIRQSFFKDEILLFNDRTDFGIFNKLNAYTKLEQVCEHIGRGRSVDTKAIVGKEIRKFGYKNTATPVIGNQVFIQNIYSTESGIIAAFGGDMAAAETVTVLTDGDEKMCRFLLGILHSRLCNFFLYRYCYNYSKLTMHTDAKYLKKLPLPRMSDELLDKILTNVAPLESESYMSAAWFDSLRQLNDIVYDAFDLDEKERAYIEKEMKLIQSDKWSS